MDFLNTKDKIELHRILSNSPQLLSPNDRSNFLTFCGLGNYCNSVQIADSSDKFSISIYNQLSINCPKFIIFLKCLSQIDSSLSEQNKQFIEYVINNCLQKDNFENTSHHDFTKDKLQSEENSKDDQNQVSSKNDNRSGGNYFNAPVTIKNGDIIGGNQTKNIR